MSSFFFQIFLNRKINAIFGIFDKKKRRFMCQTWLQDKVNGVIDDTIALSDVDDKCVLVSFVKAQSCFVNWALKVEWWITYIAP